MSTIPAPVSVYNSPNLNDEKGSPLPSPQPLLPFIDGSHQTAYQPMTGHHELHTLRQVDETLKRQIRLLRLVLRTISFCLAVLVLVPITMTLVKYLATRGIQRVVELDNGTSLLRGPWARNTKAWPTYMYFALALISVVLDGVVLLAYLHNIRTANRAAALATSFALAIVFGHVVVWVVGVALYRTEKDKNGISNDLWGWACSQGADRIQASFLEDIDFAKYCNVQSYSWYAGLVQVGAAILAAFILFLAFRRADHKKTIKKRETVLLAPAPGHAH